MREREEFDRMHELTKKKTFHRHARSSGRASSSSCKAQGEIEDAEDALDRADAT